MQMNGIPMAYRIDESLLEIDSMRKDFFSKLMGCENTEPRSFEQLYSAIVENYEGRERDRNIAALQVAFGFLNPSAKSRFMQDINNETHRRYIELTFGMKLLEEFVTSGTDEGFALFEQLRQDLIDDFMGEELKIRLDALNGGFLIAAISFAKLAASRIVSASEEFTPVAGSTALTGAQFLQNERLQIEADKILAHALNMFIDALEYLNKHGSFLGFCDTSAVANMPSLREITL